MWDIIFDNYILFLLTFTRMAGMLLFNPFLGKRNVPTIVKMGLSLFIALITTPLINVQASYTELPSPFIFIITILKEIFIGFSISFIMQMFISLIFIAGEMIDLQIGIGMSKVYDPQSNISMPLSGTIYHIIYILIFFSTNCHLTLISLIVRSCEVFPPGFEIINFGSASYIVYLFKDILVLALKLAVPIISIEILSEAGLGIIMKSVPQINVFVVGLPLKLLIGLLLIILLLPSTSRLLDVSTDFMFTDMEEFLSRMLSN